MQDLRVIEPSRLEGGLGIEGFSVTGDIANPCLYLDGVRVARGSCHGGTGTPSRWIRFFEDDAVLPLHLATHTRIELGRDPDAGGTCGWPMVWLHKGEGVDLAGFERGKRLTDARGWRTTLFLDREAGRLSPGTVRDWYRDPR